MQTERPTLRVVRAVPFRRGAVVAIAALACAALVSACGSSKTSTESSTAKTKVDTARVALSIEQTVLAKRGIHAKVACPTEVPAVPGATFECIATSTAAKPPHAVSKTPFVVTIQSTRGYVTYVGK
jgi:secreted PhoX family phosphatase